MNFNIDYKMDYIIPMYNSGESDWSYRIKNLSKILKNIPPNFLVHLVLQTHKNDISNIPGIDNLLIIRPESIKLHKLIYKGSFNKSWLYNYGVNNSATENIILGETDIIPSDDRYFKFLIRRIEDVQDWAIAWDKLLYTAENNTSVIRELPPKKGNAEGGIVYFKKSFFYSIGGANEFYRDLGGIDNDIARRAEALGGYKILPGTILHLWHPYNIMKKDNWKYSTHREDNKKIYAGLKTPAGAKNEIKRLSKYIGEIGSLSGPLISRFEEYPHINKNCL